jgi:hypothetical protein
MCGSLQLSWSRIVSGAELYEGDNIHTFATDWHFHEGWQVVILTEGGRRYQFRDGTVTAKPGQVVFCHLVSYIERAALRKVERASR